MAPQDESHRAGAGAEGRGEGRRRRRAAVKNLILGTLDVLSEAGPEAVRLLADVVRNPTFPEADFARRRTDRARQLSIARSQPQQLALEKFLGAVYPEHPYGRLFPSPQELQALTVEKA